MNIKVILIFNKIRKIDSKKIKIKKNQIKKINRSASPEKKKIVEEEEESAWDSKFQYLLALLGWAVGLGKFLKINFLNY